ncbi:DC-STAMP domain-containing protein 2 [Bombina bombina]|uniref:DC-STAMP domain-containing protein 2 n=1 Tax=Bombina bombina TaxID=8345 RepID=UPI00235A7D6A|nr:DC-STAMP domain-containing protein 2 [Bombina bombina]
MGGKRILGMCCHQCCECYNCCKALDEVSADDYIDKKKKLKSKLHKDNFCKQMLRGFGGFSVAIMLTASYALIVLFVKHYNLWFCLVSTVCIGFFLSMAMALSEKVRATVFLMLPSYFSSQAEAVIIVVILSLTMQGPVYNILENFHQSARSVSCGVELAINQTKELLEKAKHPLVGAIDYLKNAGRKLKFVGDRARKMYKAIVSGVKHAGRSLLRVWRFMVHMEEICNEELGTPYARCMKIFDDGKNKCRKALSFLAFLCYVVDIFQPLCGLAKTPLLFCLIPRYVENFMNKRIKNPIENMLNKLKGQFKFNMTIIHDFDVHINSSQHTSEMAYSIMTKVQEVMDPYVELLGMISYSVLIVNIYVYYMALMYRRQYLFDDNYDNIYITRKFIELDVMRAKQGRRTLLPLNSIEAYHFIRPSSLFLTRKEIRGYTFKIFNIFRTLLVVVFVIIIDYLIFWVLDMVAYLLDAEVVARAPVVISVHVNGSGYTADIYRNIVAAFDILQRGNVSVVSKKCAIVPSEPDYRGYVLLGVMFGVAFFISLFGVYINRLRHSICAWYYPSREQVKLGKEENVFLKTFLMGS